jgi:hypothetical protein
VRLAIHQKESHRQRSLRKARGREGCAQLTTKPSRWRRLPRWVHSVTIGALLLVVVGIAVTRVLLFSWGILFGESTAKMASLVVAASVIVVGAVIIKIRQDDQAAQAAQAAQADSAAQASGNQAGGPAVASVAVLLGLALTAYSAAELIAPNTPVAASAPACPGAPVYGAEFFAQTIDLGANARSGPGREYAQANRYAANCTLGFDGYCVGSVEQDLRLKTPDDRWLVVHGRPDQVISSAVLIDQSPERDLGSDPFNVCKQIGGLPLPNTLSGLSYKIGHSMLSSEASGAPAVGYALVALVAGRVSYVAIGLATVPPRFKLEWAVRRSLAQIPGYSASDKVWVGAAVCLADTFPVSKSLRTLPINLNGSEVTAKASSSRLPATVRPHLAQLACGSRG